jgi:Tfp pilus assembly protein PilV
MIASLLIAVILLALAYLWTTHCKHVRQDEYRKQLNAEVVAAEQQLERARKDDPHNLMLHKRLRDRWLSLLKERECLERNY